MYKSNCYVPYHQHMKYKLPTSLQQYISIKFSLHKQSDNPWMCYQPKWTTACNFTMTLIVFAFWGHFEQNFAINQYHISEENIVIDVFRFFSVSGFIFKLLETHIPKKEVGNMRKIWNWKFRFWKKNWLRYRNWTLVSVPDTENLVSVLHY